MKCDKCGGTGELQEPDEFCGAELVLWVEDTYSKDQLSCIVRNKNHGEFHADFNCPPCPLCWGIDMHTNWCPNPEGQSITDLSYQGIKYRWDDDGTYWVVPRA